MREENRRAREEQARRFDRIDAQLHVLEVRARTVELADGRADLGTQTERLWRVLEEFPHRDGRGGAGP